MTTIRQAMENILRSSGINPQAFVGSLERCIWFEDGYFDTSADTERARRYLGQVSRFMATMDTISVTSYRNEND